MSQMPLAVLTADLVELKPAESTLIRAKALLDEFSFYTEYKHGDDNAYLAHLAMVDSIPRDQVLEFLNIWYSFSRRTPQILLHCAASYKNQADRKLIMINYQEEDGLGEGQDPHYDLLEALIIKLGGELDLDSRAERMIEKFMQTLGGMSEAYATGVVAGFEHPALDITQILCGVIEKCDHGAFKNLLQEDFYLRIHVAVEPDHIVWAHGNSLAYMARSEASRAEVILGFRNVMKFWSDFWQLAISVCFEQT